MDRFNQVFFDIRRVPGEFLRRPVDIVRLRTAGIASGIRGVGRCPLWWVIGRRIPLASVYKWIWVYYPLCVGQKSVVGESGGKFTALMQFSIRALMAYGLWGGLQRKGGTERDDAGGAIFMASLWTESDVGVTPPIPIRKHFGHIGAGHRCPQTMVPYLRCGSWAPPPQWFIKYAWNKRF